MKKIFALILFLVMLLSPAALAEDGPEPPACNATGEWFAEINGIPVCLTLREDYSYALEIPAVLGESLAGAWELDDIYVRLDDADALALVSADLLIWAENDLRFTREKPWTYVPAEVLADAPQEAYNGYWKCAYVDDDGLSIPAAALRDDTDLYVDMPAVALGGARFGDVFWNFEFADGLYVADFNGQALALAYQADGFLRMTIAATDELTTLYLSPAPASLQGEAE